MKLINKLLTVLFTVLSSTYTFGQVIVTQGTGGTNLCVGQGFITLTDIVLTETLVTDFSPTSLGLPLILNTPANFEFNTAVLPGVNPGGVDIGLTGVTFPNSTTLSIDMALLGINATVLNSITISGLQVQAITTPALGGEITVNGASAFLMAGVTYGGGGTSLADLDSYTQPVADAGASGIECDLDFTLGATPTVGTGTWTQTSGVGTITGFSTNANDPTATVTVDTYGSYVFRWTEVNNTCSDFDEITVVFFQTPMFTNLPSIATICSGDQLNFTATSDVVGTVFTWTSVISANITGNTNGVGSITDILINTGNAQETVTYTVTATGPGPENCVNVTTQDYVITLDPTPQITQQADVSGCTTDTQVQIDFTSDTDPGTAYNWSVTNSALLGMPSGSGATNNIPSFTYAANVTGSDIIGVATVTATEDGCTSSVMSFTITLKADPDVLASNQIICSGETTNIVITNPNSVSGTTFSWTFTQSNVAGASSGSGTLIAQNLTVTDGSTQGTINYTITPTANGCSGTPIVVTVTVNPVPDVMAAPSAETICSGQSTNVVLSTPNGVGSVIYNWTINVAGGITGASAGSGALIAQTLTNPTNVAGLVTYTVTPTSTGCSGTPINVNIVVEPIATIATSGNETICSNYSTNIVLSNPNNVAGTTFSWIVQSNTNVTGATSGVGNTIVQTLLSTNGTSSGTVTYQITAFTGACLGAVTTVDVIVNPDVLVNAGGGQVVCEGSDLTLGGSISGGVTTGQWSTLGDGVFDDINFGTGLIYTPGSTDISTGNVLITLTADDADGVGGPCPVRIDQFVLQINPIATVSVSADYPTCEPIIIPLTGTIGGGATVGIWQVISGNGTLSASSVIGNTVEADYSPDVTDVNTIIILRLITNDPDGPSEPCTTVFADINITIEESAKVDAGVDFEICEDEVALLNGNILGSVSTGTWSIVSGGDGTFDNANDVVTNYNPGPNDMLNGATVVLRLTSSNPGTTCGITTDETTLVINKLPEVLLTGLDPVYQEDDLPVDLTGFPTTGGVGVFSGPGVSGSQFLPTIANLTPAINTVVYTFTNATTGCTNSDSFDVIINPVTTIDFDLEDPITSTLITQVCGNIGLVRIAGSPDVSTGFSLTEFTSTDPLMQSHIEMDIGTGQFSVDTDGLPAGIYPITYTFTNSFSATTSFTKTVEILPAPIPDFTVGNFCIDTPIQFTSSSSIPIGSITNWEWQIIDGSNNVVGFSTLENPAMLIFNEGNYDIVLKVTSNQGCEATKTTTVFFGAVPTVTYKAESFCDGDVTTFEATVIWGTQTPSPIIDYTWTYGDGVVDAGASNMVSHVYPNFTTYNASVQITTAEGCQASDTHAISIFPYTTVDVTTEYLESFENAGHGWVTSAELRNLPAINSDTSWVLGTPNGTIINSASDGVNAWWTGANGGNYYQNEQSFVNAPCFNLTNLERPMISMDIWNDTQESFDGSALQYSTDGGITWLNVGDVDEGINWYNESGINGRPGESTIGWSGETGEWVTARFSLNEIPEIERGQVRIRVAFGSIDGGDVKNGFAFDNVNIREKNRLILVENFTSLSNAGYGSFKDKMRAFKIGADSLDFVYMDYHIPYPEADSLYKGNEAEPVTRANVYNVSQTINTVVDGNQYQDFQLFDIELIQQRSLVDPQFSVDVQILPTDSKTLSVTWDVVAQRTVNNPIIVYTVVVEEFIVLAPGDTAFNVVKKMLPNPAGSSKEGLNSFVPGDEYSSVQLDWVIDVPLYSSDNLAVIVFVQEKTDGSVPGEIYQTAYVKITDPKDPPLILGLEGVLQHAAEAIELYPNPVTDILHFETDDALSGELTWKIIDQRGVEFASEQFYFVNGTYEYDTRQIPNGIYYLIIQSKQGALTHQKLIVMHW